MKSTSHPSRNFSLSLALSAALLVSFAAQGAVQDSESFFHQGARHFLATNEIAQARQVVTNGLRIYPDDVKLKKLWELLNQKGEDQNQSDQKQNEQDQQDQKNKDQSSEEQKDQNKDKGEQDKRSEEQQKQEQKDQASNQDKKSEDDKKQGQQASDKKGEEQPEADGSPAGKAIQMTPQQAIQLLEALKAEEKTMPFRPVLKTNRHDRLLKDW